MSAHTSRCDMSLGGGGRACSTTARRRSGGGASLDGFGGFGSSAARAAAAALGGFGFVFLTAGMKRPPTISLSEEVKRKRKKAFCFLREYSPSADKEKAVLITSYAFEEKTPRTMSAPPAARPSASARTRAATRSMAR